MSAAALAHDAFAPRRPPGMRSGLALALGVHVLLILALAWSVNWKTSEPDGVVAELWSALPQIAAPRVAAPEPTPPPPVVAEPKPAPPPPRPEPVAPPRVDAQIAIEKAEAAKKAAEAAKKAEAAKREEAKKAEAEREKERERQRLAEEQAEKKKLAEKARQDAAKEAAIREANLRRARNLAGASDDPSATGNAARTSGPSADWVGRIRARIKANIVRNFEVPGNPVATVEVRLAPDGAIISSRLTRSSGSSSWDDAVLRAIDKTGVLPRDNDGRVPSSMSIDFRPHE